MAPRITVLSWHTVFTKRVIYYKFNFVWYTTKQGTTHRPTSHLAHLYTVTFLWSREEHRQQSRWVDFAGQCLLWLLLLLLLLPQNSLLTSLAFALDSETVSATRISLMASSSSFIYFFVAIAQDPQLSALFRLLCMTWHSFRNIISVRYERLLQWKQNKSKAIRWLLYTNSSYSKVPKTLLNWWLHVAYYYPTTPTDYPSTTTGTSVGTPVAVNIEFCGYLQFLSISFVWIIWVQYATDNLSGQQLEFAS